MSRHVLLNNIDHADLRVDTRRRAALGDNVTSVVVVPDEFRNVQSHYPIVFHQGAEGSWQPLALFGFRDGENLFLDDDGWDATYLPLAIQRQPFLIGRSDHALVIHVDLDDPRVSRTQGEPLFREHGGTTDVLDHVSAVLLSLHEGLERVPAFIDALLRHRLLESFVLDVQLDDGAQSRLSGFHAINEERLRGLDAAALDDLHRHGHLEPIYMVLASLSRFRDLIGRMNRRLADA